MRPRIIVNKHTPYAEKLFSSIGDVKALASSEVSNESVRDADILIIRSETKVTKDLLEGSSVRFVGTVTIGTDHIDQEYLQQQGIVCVNAAGSNANSVAEYILSALLYLSLKSKKPLKGKTLGVVGIGNIGSKVVIFAEGLGMKVLSYDPPLARLTREKRFVPFDELLTADIITVHVPLTKTGSDPTYHMFDDRTIAQMKPGAVLINTSRGSVVETAALKNALAKKYISNAILDVWENEPVIDTELLSSALIGTPHIAGYSLDGKLNAVQMIFEQVCRYLSVAPPKHVRGLLPGSEIPELRITGNIGTVEEVLNSVISQAYDILYDDTELRKVYSLPNSERGKYFSTLRAMYRDRKEFSNYKVKVPESMNNVAKFLQLIHFK